MSKIIQMITIENNITLRQPEPSDITDEFVEIGNDENVSNMTLRMPFPFTYKDLEKYIALAIDVNKKPNSIMLIQVGGKSSGFINIHNYEPNDGFFKHKANIGYWLARTHWNKGIMTKVIKAYTDFCFSKDGFGIHKISASTFANNIASQNCLLKNNFHLEGTFKDHYVKNEKFIDAKIYAKNKTYSE